MYARPYAAKLAGRLREPRRFMVKTKRRRDALPGMEAFAAGFKPKRMLLVGGDGIPLKEFLSKPVEHWVRS